MKNEDYITKILEHVGPTIDVMGLFLLVKKIQKDERERLADIAQKNGNDILAMQLRGEA